MGGEGSYARGNAMEDYIQYGPEQLKAMQNESVWFHLLQNVWPLWLTSIILLYIVEQPSAGSKGDLRSRAA